MNTLYDIKRVVAPIVTAGGACPDSNVVVERINEAIERLMQHSDWKGTTRMIRLCTQGGMVTLPRGAVSARLVSIDGEPRLVMSQAYLFLENGPWEMGADQTLDKDLMDLGDGHPVFFDIPHNESLRVFAMEHAGDSATMTLWGYNESAEELLTNGTPGISVPVNKWEFDTEGSINLNTLQTTSVTVDQITGIAVGGTRSKYVTFYAIDSDNQVYFLAKYHPDETRPGYRRYRLLGIHDDPIASTVVMQVKLRHLKATRDTDVPSVQSMAAIKMACVAIRFENNADFVKAAGAWESAYQALRLEINDSTRGQEFRLNVSDQWALGEGMSVI